MARLRLWIVGILAAAAIAAWYLMPARYDLVAQGGTIVDGTGAAPRDGAVCVVAERIVNCSRIRRLVGRKALNATGMIVAPGFIDVHTHVERALPVGRSGKVAAWNFIEQGVTSIVTGNCGTSVVDLMAAAKKIDGNIQVNVASLIGHNSLRSAVMGRDAARAATKAEIDSMRKLVRRAMKAGALGVSVGLGYFPGSYAERSEVVALGRLAAADSGLLNFHIRDEGVDGVVALKEALGDIKRAKVRGHISHFKAAGRSQWRSIEKRLRLLDSDGEIGIDVYPYEASSTDLSPLLPQWALALTPEQLRRRLANPKARIALREEMTVKLERAGWIDYGFVQVASFWTQRDYDGRYVPEIAASRSARNRASLADQQELLISMAERGGVQLIYHEMSPDDVDAAVYWPRASVGSDAGIRTPVMDARPHPRGMGTFPKFIARYVRDGELPLAEAVRRMTGLPAEEFRLPDRGTLRPGAWADIVVFDLESIADKATYEDPLAPPVGIRHVVVNGEPVIEDGLETKRYPGRFIPRAKR